MYALCLFNAILCISFQKIKFKWFEFNIHLILFRLLKQKHYNKAQNTYSLIVSSFIYLWIHKIKNDKLCFTQKLTENISLKIYFLLQISFNFLFYWHFKRAMPAFFYCLNCWTQQPIFTATFFLQSNVLPIYHLKCYSL